ncbi:hypothetical protein IAT38_006511 [Cryptococcus sp. DSM 104549]
MEEEILQNLQAKWEAKLLESRVADFARAPDSSPGPDSPSESHKDLLSTSPPGPSGSHSQDMFPFQRQGLALPGGAGGSGGAGGAGGYGNGGGQGNGEVRVKTEQVDDVLRLRGGASDSLDGDSRPEPNAAGLLPGDDVIDSDLDDSDDELRGEADGGEDDNDVDIVFCVYDKVQRVKNKWKTVFKDGMIHINGRDYLFARCNGEFEW